MKRMAPGLLSRLRESGSRQWVQAALALPSWKGRKMAKKKVVVTDYIEPDLNWESEEMAKRGVAFEVHQLKFSPPSELVGKVRDADVVVVNMAPMTEEVITQLDRCKLIIRHGIGYDNVDLKAATQKGIRVANVPDYCPDEVAEQALTLILASWRRLFLSLEVLKASSRNGIWDFQKIYPIYRLAGKTVGIVGCGRIGSRVLKRIRAFEVNALVCDPYLSGERKRELGIETVYLETLLQQSDIVTLHTTLSQETRGMIGERQLRVMKKTAHLVNTSRGAIVETQALIQALREGWIAGAAIDVYEKEPPDPGLELFALENATLAPHLGWYSEESGRDIREKIVEDIDRFLKGQPPRYVVNQEVEALLK